MSKGNRITERHPIEPEELMAYLDGELPLERAATAAAHLERCRECQSVAADLQGVSRGLTVWQVELGRDSEIPQRIVAALEERGRKKIPESERKYWPALMRKRWKPVWIGGSAVAAVALLMMVFSLPRYRAPFYRAQHSEVEQTAAGKPNQVSSYVTADKIEGLPLPAKENLNSLLSIAPVVAGGSRVTTTTTSGTSRLPEKGPMIVRTAGLTLVTKEFEKTHSELERILRLHGGYVGQLSVGAPANSGRTLTATLRIPAEQLEAALAELKKLGRVENESQSGDEVTQRYVDLQARLANARNTEQQLLDILRNRTGKLSDVLEVEQELDRVRGEIEEMEAERKSLAHQVDFATLNLTLTEQYEQQLQAVPVSTSTRLWNAAVEGYATMVEGLVSVVLFLFSVGPSLLLWGAVLFFPIRGLWRRWRARAA